MKSGLLVGIGLEKPRPQLPGGISSLGGGSRDFGMKDMAKQSGVQSQQQMPRQKASQDEAGYIAQGQICGGCNNYTKESGDCSKVEGVFAAGDTCKQYYEVTNGNGGMMNGMEEADELETAPSAMG